MSEHLQRRAFLGSAIASCFAGLAAFAIAAPRERVVRVIAKKFVFVPATIKASTGETLVLKLTAPEVPMGFNLPDFNVRTDVVPGQIATVKFIPDRAGTFTFLCDVFCGDGHESMSGQLVVTE
jgi:cytochrome c oxidase subunit 2